MRQKILVKEKGKPMLFIEDCEFIRSHLPSSHCAVNNKNYAGFEYDHLFVKYFLIRITYTSLSMLLMVRICFYIYICIKGMVIEVSYDYSKSRQER